ncbi:hypothetical protein [Photobacterium leiognathi]|uniref:hypothetical protein n=1 Tax=Photobacterium leiognathi TaxID=553611 RepID=UPI000D16BC70|nr:hypothetical protein [Photobacterium leiognathi]PSW57878.1 hypothetical protein C0W50_07250 [Photobacterium leiognathi subsp. mandapamensis]
MKYLKTILLSSALLLLGCNGSDSSDVNTEPTDKDAPEKTFTSVEDFIKAIEQNPVIEEGQTYTLDIGDGETFVLNKDLTIKGNLIIK